jgi:ABC-type molybdate transport system substrate-binding protein
MTKRRPLWILVTLIAVSTAGCAQRIPTTAPTEAHKPSAEPEQARLEGNLVIFHAGSLTVPVDDLTKAFQEQHPDVTFETEAAGSHTGARKVGELGRQADLMMSADYTVIDNLLIPDFSDWNVRFARNTMVVAYADDAKFAEEINSENWYDVVPREAVVYGHSEPEADPCGYRTLMVWQLAEKYYDQPGLYEELNESCPPENTRPKSVELIAFQAERLPDALKGMVESMEVASEPLGHTALTFTGKVENRLGLSRADLDSMEVVDKTIEHPKNGAQTYTGIMLHVLLEEAHPSDDATLTFTASDAYSVDVPFGEAKTCVDCLVAFDGDRLRLVMPGFGSSFWVKDVVSIEAK